MFREVDQDKGMHLHGGGTVKSSEPSPAPLLTTLGHHADARFGPGAQAQY